jgi:hypothetical protein
MERNRRRVVEGAVIHNGPQKSRADSGVATRRRISTCFCFSSLARCLKPYSHQGLSHAERPKDTAPIQTRCATYFPPKAVDAECRPPQTERFRKRAETLRAVSRAGPRRSPVRQCRRGGKLLPTRRTLLQIDVPRPRRGIVGLRPTSRLTLRAFYQPPVASMTSPYRLDRPTPGRGTAHHDESVLLHAC